MLKLVNLVGFLISQLISKSIKLPKRIHSFVPFSAPKKGAPACHAEFLGLNISGYSCARIQWVFCSSQSSEYNLRNWTRRIVLLWLLFWHLQHTMGEFGSHGDQVQCSRPTMGSMASGPMWRSNWPRSIARLSAKGRRSSGAVSIVSNKLEILQLYVTRMWMCFRCQGLAIWRFQSSFKTENCFGRKLKPVVFHNGRKFSVFLETFRPTSFMSMLLGEIGSWMYSVFFTKNDTLV